MILIPKKTKYKKLQKGLLFKVALRGTKLNFGNYGLKTMVSTRITAKQIEACRKILKKRTKHLGKYWLRVFPHYPVTQKVQGSRMGKGKGAVSYWVAKIKKNQILCEVEVNSLHIAKQIFKEVNYKLPIITRIVHITKK